MFVNPKYTVHKLFLLDWRGRPGFPIIFSKSKKGMQIHGLLQGPFEKIALSAAGSSQETQSNNLSDDAHVEHFNSRPNVSILKDGEARQATSSYAPSTKETSILLSGINNAKKDGMPQATKVIQPVLKLLNEDTPVVVWVVENNL